MEDEDFAMEVRAARIRRQERRAGCLTALGLAAIVAGGSYGAIKAIGAIDSSKESKPKEAQSATAKKDRKMLRAAYEGKVDVYKVALEDGADFNAVNYEGKNALMLSLGGMDRNYEVADYILSTPELASKIDYKQVDDNGYTVSDILKSHIENYSTPRLQSLLGKVEQNLKQQEQEEAAGKARSNTCYDFQKYMQKVHE